MSSPAICPSCGATVPPGTRRCPVCDSRVGRRRLGLLALGLIASALAATTAAWWATRPRARTLPTNVRVESGGCILSRDARGTDAFGTIENLDSVPVDVTVLVRGFDMGGRLCVEKTVGPFRQIPPEQPYPISTYLDCTPLDSVSVEAVKVVRSASPPSVAKRQ